MGGHSRTSSYPGWVGGGGWALVWFMLRGGVTNKLKVICMSECYSHGHSAVQGVSLEVKGWRPLLSLLSGPATRGFQ